MKNSRQQMVLNHLLTGRSLTQGEAILLGYGTRLAAKIHRLKGKGYKICTVMKYDINDIPYAKYSLVTTQRAA